jgi:sugar O-acyltransferase (sialic acid O-acetyltransferase NeuD family)
MEQLKPLVIWGGTGQSIVIEEFVADLGYRIVAVIENNYSVQSPFKGVPIIYGLDGLESWLKKNYFQEISFIVSVAGSRGMDRVSLSESLERRKMVPISAIHPNSYIAKNAELGKGCQVMANATVCARVKLGPYCIVNTAASVDHECELGAGVHIAPGARLAGDIKVGDFSFIGAGAVVLPHITIGENAVVGAGAVVTKDVPSGVICLGNPARVSGLEPYS